MKKMLSLSFAAMFIVSCVSGCGKKDDSSSETKKESKFVGKWECEKLAWNGKEMDSLLGKPANVLLQAEIKDDGTFVAHSAMEDSVDASNEGSWKEISDTKLEVKGKLLQEAVSVTLRQGDTYCKYSSSQFLLLLVGTSKESCKIVYRRILNKYKMLAGPRAEIEYSVVSLADLPEKLAEAE